MMLTTDEIKQLCEPLINDKVNPNFCNPEYRGTLEDKYGKHVVTQDELEYLKSKSKPMKIDEEPEVKSLFQYLDQQSDLENMAKEYIELKKQADDINGRIDKLKKSITNIIGEGNSYKYQGHTFSVTRQSEVMRFDTDRFKKDHMDLYEDYQKPTTKAGYLVVRSSKKS